MNITPISIKYLLNSDASVLNSDRELEWLKEHQDLYLLEEGDDGYMEILKLVMKFPGENWTHLGFLIPGPYGVSLSSIIIFGDTFYTMMKDGSYVFISTLECFNKLMNSHD